MVKEKVEEDYKKIKEYYQAKGFDWLCKQGIVAARKFQIYECCLEWSDRLEKIPLLTGGIVQKQNLIEAVYAFEDFRGQDVQWQIFLWLEQQMEETREVYYYQYIHSGKGY